LEKAETGQMVAARMNPRTPPFFFRNHALVGKLTHVRCIDVSSLEALKGEVKHGDKEL
jgi:hypothetical protein